jgi:alpha-glucosidase
VSHDRVALFASPKGLGQAFAFDVSKEAYNAPAFRKTIDGLYQTARAAGTTTTWVLSNHDVSPMLWACLSSRC